MVIRVRRVRGYSRGLCGLSFLFMKIIIFRFFILFIIKDGMFKVLFVKCKLLEYNIIFVSLFGIILVYKKFKNNESGLVLFYFW